MRSGIDNVRACYETLLQRRLVAGRVNVRFVISATGTVRESAVVETTLGDEATERCISDAVRALVFPPPDGGGIVIVTYPFALDTNPPVQDTVQEGIVIPDAASVDIRGGISLRDVTRVVASGMDTIRGCYGRPLDSQVTGLRVSVRFIISPTGTVTTSMVSATTLGDDATEHCIANAIGALVFPPPEGGGVAIVTFPFVITTESRLAGRDD